MTKIDLRDKKIISIEKILQRYFLEKKNKLLLLPLTDTLKIKIIRIFKLFFVS
jgi:hypothetical protein